MKRVAIPASEMQPQVRCFLCGLWPADPTDPFLRCVGCRDEAHRTGRYRESETIIDFDPYNYERQGDR